MNKTKKVKKNDERTINSSPEKNYEGKKKPLDKFILV